MGQCFLVELQLTIHNKQSMDINKQPLLALTPNRAIKMSQQPNVPFQQNQDAFIQNILKQTSMQTHSYHTHNLHKLQIGTPSHLELTQSYEEYATQNLIAITQSQQADKLFLDKERTEHNGSDITRWNHNYLNILKYEPAHKKEPKFRVIRERHAPSENSATSKQYLVNYSFKKQLSRLRVPLREKTLNSEELMNSSFEKQRSKTRNDIKLEIINSKQQIMPTNAKTKNKADPNCENILKFKKDIKEYQKIRRKHCTLDQLTDKTKELQSTSNSKLKYFFLSQLESPKINLKGSSIRQLLPK